MNLHGYSVLFVSAVGIVALLVASPALNRLLVFPNKEFYSEFWVLDSNHRAKDYPFNVTRAANYRVFLGIGNRLGYAAYYLVQVKFRNQTQSAPNSFNRTSSSLPSLVNITAFVADQAAWEYPLTFSFNYVYDEALSAVKFSDLRINDFELDMTDYRVMWDPERSGFLGNLFFELWLYNQALNSFQYHNRFVGIWLNVTS